MEPALLAHRRRVQLRKASPQQCADARGEFTHAEGLGQVAIGAGIEQADLVVLRVRSRDCQDWHARPFSDFIDHAHGAHIRKTDIEQNHIRPPGAGQLDALLAALGHEDLIALSCEEAPQDELHRTFIVDHDYTVHCLRKNYLPKSIRPKYR